MKFKSLQELSIVRLIGKTRLTICLVIVLPLLFLCIHAIRRDYLPFDKAFLEGFHNAIPPLLGKILSLFYLVGDTQFAAVVVVIALGILVWKRYWQEAGVLAFATLSVLLIVDKILKPLFARSRPPNRLDPSAGGYSFPSGHATGNVVLYFYLAYVLAARYPRSANYIYVGTTLFLILMGLSSIYLRVHWPTDIIAGYSFGYLWLTVCLALLKLSSPKYQ